MRFFFKFQIDLSEVLESWAAENITADQMQVKLVWTNTSFTLKYNSDALFDFPHWFGFSKRTFKVVLYINNTISHLSVNTWLMWSLLVSLTTKAETDMTQLSRKRWKTFICGMFCCFFKKTWRKSSFMNASLPGEELSSLCRLLELCCIRWWAQISPQFSLLENHWRGLKSKFCTTWRWFR